METQPPTELSYDELMDIIVNNKPVPNVVDVPDIILDQSLATEHNLKPRLKPWELAKDVPVMGGLVRQKEETQGLADNLELVKKSNSLEKLTSYYALEVEFQKQLKASDSNTGPKGSGKSSSTLSDQHSSIT
ncbi:unnamed protein product [Kluyveromyces dobzhanskii CBS 2104]|uniref:WGS project CCBQ000000000 data, contig 00102 n=1 Tax=Kluyveromyces dobzhanskii CBS 2104 TaxID=1427455 RepID=A0A0A8L3T4_9SACH|nr:unnamed protein product [Kluyveromyces dobzhanskii CBS 2104]